MKLSKNQSSKESKSSGNNQNSSNQILYMKKKITIPTDKVNSNSTNNNTSENNYNINSYSKSNSEVDENSNKHNINNDFIFNVNHNNNIIDNESFRSCGISEISKVMKSNNKASINNLNNFSNNDIKNKNNNNNNNNYTSNSNIIKNNSNTHINTNNKNNNQILQENNKHNFSSKIKSPHDYQKKLFEEAKDKNSIIYMETGRGKTFVAVMLINYLFYNTPIISEPKLLKKKNKKVVFLVCEISLIEQQVEVLKTNTNLFTEKLVGGKNKSMFKSRKVFLENFWNKQDVVVSIPIMLYRLLYTGFLKLSEIDMLIFDECHHCDQNHTYNLIMKEFYFYNLMNIKCYKTKSGRNFNNNGFNDYEKSDKFDLKSIKSNFFDINNIDINDISSRNEYIGYRLPRIIGLTASPFKKKITQNVYQEAYEAVRNLSENLDCFIIADPDIFTVNNKDVYEELKMEFKSNSTSKSNNSNFFHNVSAFKENSAINDMTAISKISYCNDTKFINNNSHIFNNNNYNNNKINQYEENLKVIHEEKVYDSDYIYDDDYDSEMVNKSISNSISRRIDKTNNDTFNQNISNIPNKPSTKSSDVYFIEVKKHLSEDKNIRDRDIIVNELLIKALSVILKNNKTIIDNNSEKEQVEFIKSKFASNDFKEYNLSMQKNSDLYTNNKKTTMMNFFERFQMQLFLIMEYLNRDSIMCVIEEYACLLRLKTASFESSRINKNSSNNDNYFNDSNNNQFQNQQIKRNFDEQSFRSFHTNKQDIELDDSIFNINIDDLISTNGKDIDKNDINYEILNDLSQVFFWFINKYNNTITYESDRIRKLKTFLTNQYYNKQTGEMKLPPKKIIIFVNNRVISEKLNIIINTFLQEQHNNYKRSRECLNNSNTMLNNLNSSNYTSYSNNINNDLNDISNVSEVNKFYDEKKILDEDFFFKHGFKCINVVGVSAKKSDHIIVPSNNIEKLNKNIDSFKRGETSILIGTSTIEEGIDVKDCNIVIVYSDLCTPKSFIQMKGRARKTNAEFYVFTCDKKKSEGTINEFIMFFSAIKKLFKDNIVSDFREYNNNCNYDNKNIKANNKIHVKNHYFISSTEAKITENNCKVLYNETIQKMKSKYNIENKIYSEKRKSQDLDITINGQEYEFKSILEFSFINKGVLIKEKLESKWCGNKDDAEIEVMLNFSIRMKKLNILNDYLQLE